MAFSFTHVKDILLILFAFLAVLNASILLYLRRDTLLPSGIREYTYIGDDYPQTLPVDLTDAIDFPYTEDADYLQLSEDADAVAAWEALIPPGRSFAYLGPNKRRFSVTMFHQVHCLIQLRYALPIGSRHPHLVHCLNYLMHSVLCGADTTLEAEKEPTVLQYGVPVVNPFNVSHTCRDWRKVYDYMAEVYWD